jgi:hypothetical protein
MRKELLSACNHVQYKSEAWLMQALGLMFLPDKRQRWSGRNAQLPLQAIRYKK